MKTLNASLYFLLVFVSTACHSVELPHSRPQSVTVASSEKEVAKKVKAIITRFHEANCAQNPDGIACRKIEVNWTPADPLPSSQNQRILILEDRLPPHSIFGRYRNRVLGIYDIEKSIREQYFPIFPKARIYSAYDEIGLYLAGLPHVPVQSLELYRFPGVSEISDAEAINYKDEEPGEWIRHQEDLFELLADLNPHAQFVIARYPSMGKDAELICNYVHEERRIALERYYYGAGISLLDLVKKHGITHVNVSFVLRWIQSIKNIARQECGIDPDQVSDEYWKELLEIERAPLEALKQAQSTTLVFKGLDNYPKYEVNPSSFDYLNQCTPYANFIRVGHFSVADSQMPATGIPAKLEWLDRNQKKNTRCADLFVNGGFEKKNIHDKAIFGPKPLPFIVDGLQYFIAGQEHVVMSSSIATPLALSYSIYLQERYHQTHHRYPTTDEIIADLRVNPGDPWMIDPLLHDQFDLLIKE